MRNDYHNFNPPPERFKLWLYRVARFIVMHENGLIPEEDLQAYQLFIIEFGQYNANFTWQELERLDYPLSPFMMMHTHGYIRSIDTWAMEVLRVIYQQQHKNSKLFPIWIDSHLFWTELERYCH